MNIDAIMTAAQEYRYAWYQGADAALKSWHDLRQAIIDTMTQELEQVAELEHLGHSCYWPSDHPEAIFCPAHQSIYDMTKVAP